MATPPSDDTLDFGRPFRPKDARAAGLTRRALSSGQFRRIARGVYLDAGVRLDPRLAAEAATLLAGSGSFVSHHTAARLYGAVVPDDDCLHASVRGTRHRARTEGIVVHRSRRVPGTFGGVRVTSPSDTFLDLAASLSLVDLVVLGDSLVGRRRCTPEALVDAAAAGERRTRRAARAASLVRSGVDSPMETRLRLLVTLAGLPEPEVNIVFSDDRGEVSRRIDMGYRAHRLGLEYDGRQHAESTRQYSEDVRRREEFAGLGWLLWTAVSSDLYTAPGVALERIVAAMRLQGMRPPPLRDHWRRHFPGRI